MQTPLIGRKKEQEILQKALRSNRAEMIAVIGRMRVGKTFLIRSFFKDDFDFEITGIQSAPQKEQMCNFKIKKKLYIQQCECTTVIKKQVFSKLL